MSTTTTINPNPSPKFQFLQSPDNAKKHLDLIASPEFNRGIQFALLQHQHNVATSPIQTPSDAMGHFFKIQGAIEFVQTLRLLAIQPQMPKPVDRDNLGQ